MGKNAIQWLIVCLQPAPPDFSVLLRRLMSRYIFQVHYYCDQLQLSTQSVFLLNYFLKYSTKVDILGYKTSVLGYQKNFYDNVGLVVCIFIKIDHN